MSLKELQNKLNKLSKESKDLLKILGEKEDDNYRLAINIKEWRQKLELFSLCFYEYKTRSNSKYISKQVKSEKIKYGLSICNRAYETDALGNITKVNDSVFGSHTYEYDYRGFLTKADGEDIFLYGWMDSYFVTKTI